ncbi:MAG: acetyl-CoA carboxylase carboxyltransferase subunit alpha [Anaeroplasmataceae bacterium]
MTINECEILVKSLEEQLSLIDYNDISEYQRIKKEIDKLRQQAYKDPTPYDRVCMARSIKRPKAFDYINSLFTDFIELHGDYYFKDDVSIIAGIAKFNGVPVTVIAQAKGKNIEENIKRNFGSNSPEGFRKSLRLAKQAEKFNRPIITIVDTSGAYPGRGAEERGQSRAIAQNLMEFSSLKVPVLSLVIGEGGSGGALALSVANKIIMLENAVYSILSPEGLSSILFKDTSRVKEVCDYMKLTAADLFELKIVDYLIKEPIGGAEINFNIVIEQIKNVLIFEMERLAKLSINEVLDERYAKFRTIGETNNEM